jgi:histone deacetylase 1/2
MDSGATSHMTSLDGILLRRRPTPISSILIGNGTSILVTSHGHSVLPTTASNFALNNVLVVPSIVQNLLSVRRFTRDNHVSIEFDAFGFSVKELPTGRVIHRCNSTEDLYTWQPSSPTASALVAASSTLWHQRLGHPAPTVLARLNKNNLLSCNKAGRSLCHSCQLGKHFRLPFTSSSSHTTGPFELVHCDVWTSPVLSVSGFSYYLVILDDYSHFCWTFPLRRKSDVHQTIVTFVAYVRTQFGLPVKCFQADNGTEFVNTATSTFLAAHGTLLRLSCPYTSAQNGKAECVLRTLNNSVRTRLLHASMPAPYWAEALATACYLLNRRPSSAIRSEIPYTRLYRESPSYAHLRVFGCLCYPNLQVTSAHKLAPRSTACLPWVSLCSQRVPLPRPGHPTCLHLSPRHLRRDALSLRRHSGSFTGFLP